MHSEFVQAMYYSALFALLFAGSIIFLGVVVYDIIPWAFRMLKVIFLRKG